MSSLSKIQKYLKQCKIRYNFSKDEKTNLGRIDLFYEGQYYSISEYTGNRGRSVSGILSNVNEFKNIKQYYSQESILNEISDLLKRDYD